MFGLKISIWWSVVALLAGLLLPVESCGLKRRVLGETLVVFVGPGGQRVEKIGRASCRERVCSTV